MAHNQKVVGSNPTPATKISHLFIGEDFFCGEFEGVVETVDWVWRTGELGGGKFVAETQRDFFGDEFGVWRDNRSAEDLAALAGE